MTPTDRPPAVPATVMTLALAPPPPLTSTIVVLGTAAHVRWQVVAVPHVVVAAISDCLDHAIPKIWTLPRACEASFLSLLPRLAARGISDGVDSFYWRHQCSQGLVSAVKSNNLEMIEWLHAFCPSVLPYKAMIEAARKGSTRLVKCLSNHHKSVVWLPQMMDAAASSGQFEMLKWLNSHRKKVGCSTNAITTAIQNGHFEIVQWLFNR